MFLIYRSSPDNVQVNTI